MEENKELERATQVYEKILQILEKDEWKYERNDENLAVRFTVRGDDIPMDFTVYVDPSPGLLRVQSWLPFEINKDKMIDAAVAVCAINLRMKNGSFDFDFSDGTIRFKVTQTCIDGQLDEEVFRYLLFLSSYTVDEYNDKMLMLSKGGLKLEDFLEEINS